MINNLKLGFKIMKYGHAAKLTYIASAVLLVIGIFFCILSCIVGGMTGEHNLPLPGGYFMSLVAMFLLQMLSTVNAVNLVQTSPQKRRLQTSVPAAMSVTLMMAGYLFSAVILGITCLFHPEAIDSAAMQLIAAAILSGIVMVYYGACYKYFYTSTILFFIAFFFIYDFDFSSNWVPAGILPADGTWAGWVLALVLGVVIILVGGFLQYLISLAVYKAPVSKMALGAKLRAEM